MADIKPVRITLSRTAGFRLQAHSLALNGLPCVKVDRTTKWGNPFRAGERFDVVEEYCTTVIDRPMCRTAAEAVEIFRDYMCQTSNYDLLDDCRRELRGKNLACWCKPGEPCHADVLLELANG